MEKEIRPDGRGSTVYLSKVQYLVFILAAISIIYSLWLYLGVNNVGYFQWYYSDKVNCTADVSVDSGFRRIELPFSVNEAGHDVCFVGLSDIMPRGKNNFQIRVDDSIRRVYFNGKEISTSESGSYSWKEISITNGIEEGTNKLVVDGYNNVKNTDFDIIQDIPKDIRYLSLAFVFLFIIISPNLKEKPLVLMFSIGCIILLFLLPIFARYNYWGIGDWNQFQTFYQTAKNTILHYHQFPFWNPYICGGNVQLAYPQPAFLTPFFLTLLLVDVAHGIKLNMVLYLITGAFGCYLLSRKLNFGTYSTLLFSLTFVLGGYIAHRINQGHVVVLTVIYLPYILLFYWKSLEDIKYAPIVSLFVGLFILEAHPFLTTVLILLLVFYPLFMLGVEVIVLAGGLAKSKFLPGKAVTFRVRSKLADALKPVLVSLVVLMLAFLLTSFKVVPTLFFSRDYPREVSDNTGFNLDLIEDSLIGVSGYSSHAHDWGWHEYNGYIGYLSLILAFFGALISFRNKKLVPLFIFLIFITLYSFNQNSPVNVWDLFHKLPLFSSQHLPMRSISFITFILSLFAGVGLNEIEKSNKNFPRVILIIAVASLFTVNTPLLEGAFTYTPRMEYTSSIGAFHQAEDYNDKGGPSDNMYSFTLQDVGVTNCYAPGGLNNRATPIQEQGYRGEAYLLSSDYARMVEFSPNEMKVVVNATKNDTLVLNQNYYKGWYANDRPAGDANGLVSSKVDAETRTVVFRYIPPGFEIGAALTFLGILLSTIIYFGQYRRPIMFLRTRLKSILFSR